MENPPISFFNHTIGVPAAYSGIRLYLSLMRIRVDREQVLLNHLQQGGKAIVAFWHPRFFGAIGYAKKFRSLAPSAIISKSRDGELIARGSPCASGSAPCEVPVPAAGKMPWRQWLPTYPSTRGHAADDLNWGWGKPL